MAIGFSKALQNIKSDGLASWYIKRAGDTGHYSLGALEDGKIEGELLTEESSLLQNLPVSFKFVASAKCVNTDETTLIKSLDTLSTNGLNHIITAANGMTFGLDAGTTFKLISDADMDKNMYLQIDAEGIVLQSGSTYPSWQTIVGTNTPGTPVSTDALYSLNGLPTTRNPAGFRQVLMKLHGIGTYEDMGAVRKGKLTLETMVQKDGFQMPRAYGLWKISVEFDQMQTSSEYALLPPIANIDLQIVLACGYTLTVGNNVGLSWQPKLLTNTKDIALTHWKCEGNGPGDGVGRLVDLSESSGTKMRRANHGRHV